MSVYLVRRKFSDEFVLINAISPVDAVERLFKIVGDSPIIHFLREDGNEAEVSADRKIFTVVFQGKYHA